MSAMPDCMIPDGGEGPCRGYRALLAERDAAVARADGWKEAFDRSSRLRAGDAAERRHLVAEMARRGHLDLLREIDREWLAQTAAHAETPGILDQSSG